MEGIDRPTAGSVAGRLSVEGTLLRAALLAGCGAEATSLAQRLAAATRRGDGRSCLEAGAPLQFTVDAPGPAGLRVGLRLGEGAAGAAVAALIPEPRLQHLRDALRPLPPSDHATLGTWLFWTEQRQSLFVDLRDPDPQAALHRLRSILDTQQRQRLDTVDLSRYQCRPWALRLEAAADGVKRLHLHWLMRGRTPRPEIAEAIAPGRWPDVIEALGYLLRRPGASGRWTFVTPLDKHSDPALRVGNSAWTLVPENDDKHRAVGRITAAYGGERDYAEAMWSFCRGAAGTDWKAGRACEIRAGEEGVRVRLFMTPNVGDIEAS